MRLNEIEYNNDYIVTGICGLRQHWRDKAFYSYTEAKRPDSGLTLILSGIAEYIFEGRKFQLMPDQSYIFRRGVIILFRFAQTVKMNVSILCLSIFHFAITPETVSYFLINRKYYLDKPAPVCKQHLKKRLIPPAEEIRFCVLKAFIACL